MRDQHTSCLSAHSDVRYILRFIQVTKPIISSRIIRFQVEDTNIIVALAVFMFILNVSVEQTKFRYCNNGGSIYNRNLTINLSIDIYGSRQCKAIHQARTYTSSDSHGIRKSIYTPIDVFEKICLEFSIENCVLQRCLRRNSEVFTAFYDIHIVK